MPTSTSVAYTVYVGAEPPSSAPPALDGEVTSSAEILAVAENSENAGNSYWMRGGTYSALTLDTDARPASRITFITYPGEQVVFTGDVRFDGAANLRFDGNETNRTRSTAGGYPDGGYGLWFKGAGIAGYDIPAVGACLNFIGVGSDYAENLEFANFRVGDAMSTDESEWRCQHGIGIDPTTRALTFEDFEIAYIGSDLRDMEAGGDGDANGGGYGVGWFGASSEWGDFTFRRGHWHHTMNDFVFLNATNAAALTLFEDCLFEQLENFGDAHADMVQNVGSTQPTTFRGCVFRDGTDFLLHGDNPGGTRLFENCLIGYAGHQQDRLTIGKSTEGGATDYQWRDCTLQQLPFLMVDSTAGASFTSNMVWSNNIFPGFSSATSVDYDDAFTDDGEPNVVTGGGTGLSGDSAGSPTFDADMNCTNFSQGFRMPATFPWAL